MKTHHIIPILVLLCITSLFSQNRKDNIKPIEDVNTNISKTKLSGNTVFPVHLDGAHYDVQRNNMPYFVNRKTIPLNNIVKAVLVNTKTIALSDEVASQILSHFKNFIGNEFSIEITYGQSGREH